ncbi:MAG TPA: GNAT family N-acetyltransferase [Thermoanaerobaculia bacterium]|nr:GNAT family N-acetyltransferase [Thermoanaerobaculia bacterium]
MRIEIRRATPHDSQRATELARRAKAHWGYPAEWLALWHDDLRISEHDITAYPTFVASVGGEVVGVCQLRAGDVGAILEHVWVDPKSHGQGVGRALVEHATSGTPGVVAVVADPNAERFYIRLGAKRVGDVLAPMPGAPDRTLPLLEFDQR